MNLNSKAQTERGVYAAETFAGQWCSEVTPAFAALSGENAVLHRNPA